LSARTLRELVSAGAEELREAAGAARENPVHEARMLLQAAVGLDRGRIVAFADEPVGHDDLERFWDMVGDRARGVPLQLIVGSTEFHEVTLAIRDGVFIPRPETEILVEEARADVSRRLAARPPGDRPFGVSVLDLCTGSGAIVVALAAAFREEHRLSVYAGDWSPRAVRAARDNALRNGVEVDVRRSDLFSAFADLERRVDALVSNPPYIALSEAEALPLEVRLGDPKEALFDPDGGTGFHRRIADRGRAFLRPGGLLLLEIGETQGEEVAGILRESGYAAVTTLPDLTGRDRFVRGRAPEEDPPSTPSS
jgi:release factor glutamine methyltransferase